MNSYDDFAISPASFEQMAKEFSKQKNLAQSLNKEEIFNSKQSFEKIETEYEKQLNDKIEYLLVLVKDLKTRTSNNNILLVLNNLQTEIQNQQKLLGEIFAKAEQCEAKVKINMFCNNLKIALNTTSDIVKLLIKIKDLQNISYEQKEMLTESINVFLNINNNLVSLFGECRYLVYK